MILQTGGNQAGGEGAETEISQTGRGEGGDQVCNQGQGAATIISGWLKLQLN